MVDSVSGAAVKLGVTVRRFRDRSDITRRVLAERSGFDLSSIARIENGQTNTTLHGLIQLATALGVEPGALLAGMTGADLPAGIHPFSEADYRRELQSRGLPPNVTSRTSRRTPGRSTGETTRP